MPKTVTVRIAVGVAPGGQWNAYGNYANEYDLHACNASEIWNNETGEWCDGVQVHWVTAEVPIPEPQEIPATKVERANTDPSGKPPDNDVG